MVITIKDNGYNHQQIFNVRHIRPFMVLIREGWEKVESVEVTEWQIPEASPNQDQFLKLYNKNYVYVIYMSVCVCLNASILVYYLVELNASQLLVICYN